MTTIRTEHHFAQPPAAMWTALTDPVRVSRWLMPTDLVAELGARFTFDAGEWGTVLCEVLAVEPGSLLSYSWKSPPLDTTVTWTLTAEGTGTRLVLEHAGFDLEQPMQKFAYQNMGGGWAGMVSGRLENLLAEE